MGTSPHLWLALSFMALGDPEFGGFMESSNFIVLARRSTEPTPRIKALCRGWGLGWARPVEAGFIQTLTAIG